MSTTYLTGTDGGSCARSTQWLGPKLLHFAKSHAEPWLSNCVTEVTEGIPNLGGEGITWPGRCGSTFKPVLVKDAVPMR